MQTRNAASVLPEPVGAEISASRPARISGQPSICGSVGLPKRVREPFRDQGIEGREHLTDIIPGRRNYESPAPKAESGLRFRLKLRYVKGMTAEQKRSLASVVTVDREIMHGTPCFTGTRIPVQTLVDFLESGDGIDDFLAVYPAISRRQILDFLELSRDITFEQITCASF